MNVDLALFLPDSYTGDAMLFHRIDALVKPHAREKQLESWHPYEFSNPHTYLDHFPMAFITPECAWAECDPNQETSAERMVKKRQRAFTSIFEEEQVRDPITAPARSLVRMAIWEADRTFPLTPWRRVWRQGLLDHAHTCVVFLACEATVHTDEESLRVVQKRRSKYNATGV